MNTIEVLRETKENGFLDWNFTVEEFKQALSSAIQAYEENERLVKENEQISLDIQLYFPFKEIAEKLQAKLDRINEESVEKIASETCENCRAFSSRRLCGVENGSICKEIAKAICKLKE